MTVTSEQFSGCEYFSRIEVIFSGASFLAHRLFTIPASCVVTLGPFFSSSMRPTLSSVSNSSLTSVCESIAAPGSLFERSSYTSSSDAVTLIASVSLFGVLCLGEESSSGSEEDALWRRWYLGLVGHDFPAHRVWKGARIFELNEWSTYRSRHSFSQPQTVCSVLDPVGRLFASVPQNFRPVGIRVHSFQC